MRARRFGLAPLAGLLLLAALAGAYFLWPGLQAMVDEAFAVLTGGDRERIQEWIEDLGGWGPLMIVAAMTAQMFLVVVPSWGLMIVAVLAYGAWAGALLSLAAILVAGVVGFFVGRALGRGALERLIGRRSLRRAEVETERYGTWAVVVTRLNPLLSNDAISIAAGALGMSLRRFLLATAVGVAPLAALIGYFGGEAGRLENGLIAIGTAALLLLGARIWYDKRRESVATS